MDSPEFVLAKGKFTGKMDFSLAILAGIPLGTVVGHLSLDGPRRDIPFTGTCRLPFVLGLVFPVQAGEYGLGYPAVRFEIKF